MDRISPKIRRKHVISHQRFCYPQRKINIHKNMLRLLLLVLIRIYLKHEYWWVELKVIHVKVISCQTERESAVSRISC